MKVSFIAVLSTLGVLSAPNTVLAATSGALELLNQGYLECKSAHLMRRKDFDQAKESYDKYLDFRSKALDQDLRLAESDNPEVKRILSYCETVGTDILRTEALPIFQQGADACGEARDHLRNNEFDDAEASYRDYLSYKEQAVRVTGAILEVFSVASEIRSCERVWEEIQVAGKRYEAWGRQLEESLGHARQSLELCQAKPLDTEDELDDTQQLEILLNQSTELEAHLDAAPDLSALLEQEGAKESDESIELADLAVQVQECVSGLQAAIEKEQQRVAAAEEAARIAREEAEALAAAEAGPAEETPEQTQARLEKNAAYYKLVKRVSPEFPKRALSRGKGGYVVLEYKINTDGEVIDPVILESEPKKMFDKAAINAVKQWQYKAQFTDVEPDLAIARTRMSFDIN